MSASHRRAERSGGFTLLELPVVSRRRCAAFTLVELLVVIGIIAVLIAILLPSLAAARRSAQLTACAAKLKDIGNATQAFAAERRGWYPLAGNLPVQGTPEGAADSDRQKYTWVTNATGGQRMAMWHESLSGYMGVKLLAMDVQEALGYSNTRFWCPSAPQTNGELRPGRLTTFTNSNWNARLSYAMNEGVFGWNDSLRRLRGRATKVRRSAETMQMMDGQSTLERDPFTAASGEPGGSVTVANLVPPPVTLGDALAENGKAGNTDNFDPPRHKNRCNILFMDGHVTAYVIAESELRSVFILP